MSKYSQKEFSPGLYELTEETRTELSKSKYFSEDLIPTSKGERTWTTYNIGVLWIGMCISIPTFSYAAALVVLGLSPMLAILNVLIANVLILIPMQLNSHAGTKYGLPFPIFARCTFGIRGAHLPALARALVATGWCAVQCWIGGGAFAALIGIFVDDFDTAGTGRFIGFGLFLILTLWIGIRGSEGIKWLENIGSPILIVICVAMFVWAIQLGHSCDHTLLELLSGENNHELLVVNGGVVLVFLAGITSNMGCWASMALNIPDFSRYARSQKDQFMGQVWFMPISMVACSIIGAAFAEATKLAYGEAVFDPTLIFLYLDNKVIVFVATIGVILATVTTNMAANVVAPANGFANLMPQKLNYKRGVLITCVLVLAFRPWWMYGDAGAFMFVWLSNVGTILAPVAAVFVADYFIVKEKRITVAEFYTGEGGRYWYHGGVNIRAVVAWLPPALIPIICGFIDGNVANWIVANGYIFAFSLAFILYILLMKTDKKSFVSEEEFNEISQPYSVEIDVETTNAE